MLFFSRLQKVALIILLLALISGFGALMYARGRASVLNSKRPFFTEPPPLAMTPAPSVTKTAQVKLNSVEIPPAVDQTPLIEPATTATPVIPATQPATSPLKSHTVSRRGPKLPPKHPISLNSASMDQLQQLPGIGPVMAERIIQYRKDLKSQNGRGFASLEQILEVRGIGQKKYAKLKQYLTL